MRVVVVILLLLYPILIYAGLHFFEPRWLAVLLCGAIVVRYVFAQEKFWGAIAVGTVVLTVVTWFGNTLLPLKLYPVLVNGVMFAIFCSSLFSPMSAIERIARLREPDLPLRAVAYTRKVTIVWCIFFMVNGLLALLSACYATDEIWALYNGLLAYMLMGILFAGEYLVRRRVMSKVVNE